jgi:hypothetical protein
MEACIGGRARLLSSRDSPAILMDLNELNQSWFRDANLNGNVALVQMCVLEIERILVVEQQ